MKNGGKRGRGVEKEEIERFCQGAAKVLTEIHDRVDEKQSKKQQKKKKTTALIAPE